MRINNLKLDFDRLFLVWVIGYFRQDGTVNFEIDVNVQFVKIENNSIEFSASSEFVKKIAGINEMTIAPTLVMQKENEYYCALNTEFTTNDVFKAEKINAPYMSCSSIVVECKDIEDDGSKYFPKITASIVNVSAMTNANTIESRTDFLAGLQNSSWVHFQE